MLLNRLSIGHCAQSLVTMLVNCSIISGFLDSHVSQQTELKSCATSYFALDLLPPPPAHWLCLPFSGCSSSMDLPGFPIPAPPVVLIFPRHLLFSSICFNHRYTLMSEYFSVLPLFPVHRLQNHEEKGKEAQSISLLPIFLYLTASYSALLALKRLVFRTTYLK